MKKLIEWIKKILNNIFSKNKSDDNNIIAKYNGNKVSIDNNIDNLHNFSLEELDNL